MPARERLGSGSRRQSRSVSYVYGGVSALVLLVVATVALVVAPPTPPSVAEFTPSPDETIADAPPQQSSRFGAGAGACAVGQSGCENTTTTKTTATTTRREVVRSRVRRCVGDPPRQIEDPQSPPCVNYFEGDNGGRTTRGVTRDEILVAVPQGAPTAHTNYDAFVPFFNKRFELYGRQIRLVKVGENCNQACPGQAEGQRAAAAATDDAGAFAALLSRNGDVRPLQQELARRGIVSVGASDLAPEESLAKLHPYAWGTTPASTPLRRSSPSSSGGP